MSILLNLETYQIDYTTMFVHASIDCLVYVEISKGFSIDGYVWKLNKYIYGIRQSTNNFLYNEEKLEKMGFHKDAANPCLFISANVFCLNYIDNNLYIQRRRKCQWLSWSPH